MGMIRRGRAVVVGGGLALFTVVGLYAQQVQVSPANRTIAVTTTDEAQLRADTAVVHVGFQLFGATSDEVNQRASQASHAITAALADTGVAKDSIESEQQSTQPVQEYEANQVPAEDRAQHRFMASQSWNVHVPAAGASKALAAAVAAGANQSGNIDWTVADEGALGAQAAGKALRHAQQIAEQMAGGLNAKLGPLVYASNVAEQLRDLPLPGRGQVMMKSMASTAQAVELQLGPPMVKRSATVSAVFSIQ
jgi:uncharacterized protein YggE